MSLQTALVTARFLYLRSAGRFLYLRVQAWRVYTKCHFSIMVFYEHSMCSHREKTLLIPKVTTNIVRRFIRV